MLEETGRKRGKEMQNEDANAGYGIVSVRFLFFFQTNDGEMYTQQTGKVLLPR